MCTTYPIFQTSGIRGFEDAIGSVKAVASNYIQEITFLGGCLMWSNDAFRGERIWLNIFVIVWSDMWKSCERESVMMFYVPLVSFEYRYVSLLTSVHTSQRDTASCDSMFTVSKDDLCIQPSVLELSMNAKMCDLCPSYRMVM